MINQYTNIILDLFAIIVLSIVFFAILNEHRYQKTYRSKIFIALLTCISIVLVADLVSWITEGRIEYALITTISNTVAPCASYISIFFFILYFSENLLDRNKIVTVIKWIFGILGCVMVVIMIFNAVYGFIYRVDEHGHYIRVESFTMAILYLFYPLLAFMVVILIAVSSKETPRRIRYPFILYTVFPVVGVVVDYYVHGLSITYVGLVISILIIYTNIYLRNQRIIQNQKTALMMSQINPHFMYNTLSTIACMCETSPKQAKNLTIDFSNYLRQNLDTLTANDLIPFEQEMKHVECYLKIEKARFGDRLNVLYSTQCEDFYVPALTVQPIVENAVRHGITKKSRGGTIKILSYSTERSYIVEVIDDGKGFNTMQKLDDGKTHIGVVNVKTRLQRMCNGTLNIKSTPNVGTRVTIEIPKKKGK